MLLWLIEALVSWLARWAQAFKSLLGDNDMIFFQKSTVHNVMAKLSSDIPNLWSRNQNQKSWFRFWRYQPCELPTVVEMHRRLDFDEQQCPKQEDDPNSTLYPTRVGPVSLVDSSASQKSGDPVISWSFLLLGEAPVCRCPCQKLCAWFAPLKLNMTGKIGIAAARLAVWAQFRTVPVLRFHRRSARFGWL